MRSTKSDNLVQKNRFRRSANPTTQKRMVRKTWAKLIKFSHVVKTKSWLKFTCDNIAYMAVQESAKPSVPPPKLWVQARFFGRVFPCDGLVWLEFSIDSSNVCCFEFDHEAPGDWQQFSGTFLLQKVCRGPDHCTRALLIVVQNDFGSVASAQNIVPSWSGNCQ